MAGQETKYQKVIDWITEEIDAGRLQPGERLMTEEKMGKKFGLSRQTIRRATQELVEKGILTRVQGSGTYVGNKTRKFRKERYGSIAVVSTFCERYIFPPILSGIENVLSQEGYVMQVSFTNNRISNEATVLKMILEKGNVDGLIIEPSKGALPNPNIKYYKEILERHIPVIFLNDAYPALEIPCVRLDDKTVAAKATRLLVEAGHKNIAGIFKLDDGQGHRRYEGFLNAVMEADLQISPRQVFWVDSEALEELEKQADYLLDRMEECTGVVCYNDEVAIHLIDIVTNRGIRVPEDLSVVSIDDSDLAINGRVPFTSFTHPKQALGEKIAKNLLEMIDNPFYDGNYIFDADPVLRNSVRRI